MELSPIPVLNPLQGQATPVNLFSHVSLGNPTLPHSTDTLDEFGLRQLVMHPGLTAPRPFAQKSRRRKPIPQKEKAPPKQRSVIPSKQPSRTSLPKPKRSAPRKRRRNLKSPMKTHKRNPLTPGPLPPKKLAKKPCKPLSSVRKLRKSATRPPKSKTQKEKRARKAPKDSRSVASVVEVSVPSVQPSASSKLSKKRARRSKKQRMHHLSETEKHMSFYDSAGCSPSPLSWLSTPPLQPDSTTELEAVFPSPSPEKALEVLDQELEPLGGIGEPKPFTKPVEHLLLDEIIDTKIGLLRAKQQADREKAKEIRRLRYERVQENRKKIETEKQAQRMRIASEKQLKLLETETAPSAELSQYVIIDDEHRTAEETISDVIEGQIGHSLASISQFESEDPSPSFSESSETSNPSELSKL